MHTVGIPKYGSQKRQTAQDIFLSQLHQMDKATEAQGLRAFVWNIEQTI